MKLRVIDGNGNVYCGAGLGPNCEMMAFRPDGTQLWSYFQGSAFNGLATAAIAVRTFASTGSSGNPHLHFVVLPNAVERECVDLQGLDELHLAAGWAVSKNLPWQNLVLPDPPSPLPGARLCVPPGVQGFVPSPDRSEWTASHQL